MWSRFPIAVVLGLTLWGGMSAGQTRQSDTPPAGPAIDAARLGLTPAARSRLRQAVNRGDWRQVESLLIEQAETQPESAELPAALGAVHFHNGRYLQSAIAYNKARRIKPLDELDQFTLATAYIALGRRHWARPELRKLAAMNRQSPVYPYWLAGIYYYYQWFGDAIAELRKAIELDPGFAPAYDRLGQCLEGMGKLGEALPAYEKAVALNKEQGNGSPWADWHLGSLLHDLGRLGDAELTLRDALTKAPELPQVHYDLGVVLRKRGKLDAAQAILLRASELDPSDPKPHYALAEVHRRLGNKEKTLEELQKFRELSRKR